MNETAKVTVNLGLRTRSCRLAVQYVSVGPTRIQSHEVVYIRGVDIAVRIARSDHVATACAFLRQNTTVIQPSSMLFGHIWQEPLYLPIWKLLHLRFQVMGGGGPRTNGMMTKVWRIKR